MVNEKSWGEFRSSGMLWFVNRILHTFGWAIVLSVEEDGTVSSAYPARVKFRGFDEKTETDGFTKVTRFMCDEAESLMDDVNEG